MIKLRHQSNRLIDNYLDCVFLYEFIDSAGKPAGHGTTVTLPKKEGIATYALSPQPVSYRA